MGSEIVLSCQVCQSLRLLYDSIEPDSYAQMRERLHTEAFLLANILCHELCHAVMFARFGHGYNAFEQQPSTEHGVLWEMAVLGGASNRKNGELRIMEFPPPILFKGYIRNTCAMKVVAVPKEDMQVVWLAPIDSIATLFNPSFWNTEVKVAGADAVLFPKVCGYRYDPKIARGVCRCFACQQSEAIVEHYMKGSKHSSKHVLHEYINKIKSTFARENDSAALGEPQDRPGNSVTLNDQKAAGHPE